MKKRGFTLVELLVVLVIILLVSVLAIRSAVMGSAEYAVTSSAGLVQAALVQARDRAAQSGAPSGIRFLPDPSFPMQFGGYSSLKALAANRWIFLETPGDYTAGKASVYPAMSYPATITGGLPCLVVEESAGEWQQQSGGQWVFVPNEPTSWYWTIRVGEQLRIGSGKPLTVCGPMLIPPAGIMVGGVLKANPEEICNVGDPGTVSPLSRTLTSPDGLQSVTVNPQFLLLVNGLDDNSDGWIDSGWDGVDNDGNGLIDDAGEWETETWPGPLAAGLVDSTYSIGRRPAPSVSIPGGELPSSAVVDLTTCWTTHERTRAVVDPLSGLLDLIVFADGTVRPSLPYAVPSSIGLAQAWTHLWIAERSAVVDPPPGATGPGCTLPVPPAGNCRIVTVGRSGRFTVTEPSTWNAANPSAPFLAIQQGDR